MGHEPGNPVYVFVVDPRAPWPPDQVDQGADAAALARFVARVQENHVVRQFADPAVFREDLLLTLGPHRPANAGLPASPPRLIPPRPAPHAVPPFVSGQPFVGRDAVLAELDDWAGSAEPVLVVEAIGGLGKSALSWRWFNDHAPRVLDGLKGRLWWSFYDSSASITGFLTDAAAYLTGRSAADCAGMSRRELLASVIVALRTGPYLLVLDGFERMLSAYHRLEPALIRDDDVDTAGNSLSDPFGYDVLRALVYGAPSKILINSRLMPGALEGAAGWPVEGVRRLRLPGLATAETYALLGRLQVHGHRHRVGAFFDRLGNHPLLIGAVCGMVRDYRPAPGDFDAWSADPDAGAGIRLDRLRLSGRQTRVLTAVFAGLDPDHLRVLQAVSLLPSGASFAALKAVNPYRPGPSARWEPFGSLGEWLDDRIASGAIHRDDRWRERDRLLAEAQNDVAATPVIGAAEARLDRALVDLERRGLLLWDRSTNTYDLHPTVRAFAYDEMAEADRVRANRRVRDYFSAQPPEDLDRVTGVDDLRRSITVFRALAGAGSTREAAALYRERLGPTLYEQLGANETIIELLQPLAERLDTTDHLRAALNGARHLDAAHDLAVAVLGRALAEQRPLTFGDLEGVLIALFHRGDLAAADRLTGLAERLFGRDPAERPFLLLRSAELAVGTGRHARARDYFGRAAAALPGPDIFVEAAIAVGEATLALRAGSLDEAGLRDLDRLNPSVAGQFHAAVARLNAEYWLRRNRLGRAMTAADEYSRRCRDKGLSPLLGRALQARVFACAGNAAPARLLADQVLAEIDELHVNLRPYADLAEALILLRAPEAAGIALAEYRRAWADGPPHSYADDLRHAAELVRRAGATVPVLPVTDPATVRLALEEQLLKLIDELD